MTTEDLNEFDKALVRGLMKLAPMFLTALFLFVVLWRLLMPQLTLYRIETERRAQVAEARAKRDAAMFLAEAEIERARGVAEANRVIAESITDEYVRWLYVDQLDQIEGQIIYVPTEAGIPILEAGRTQEPTE